MNAPAGLSLDLDNAWSYLRNRGDAAWRDYPSFLDRAVPRILEVLGERGLNATVFVVGEDAARQPQAIARLAAAGHEIGNHSFGHRSGYHGLSRAEVEADLAAAEAAIEAACGALPRGFRAPSFALSAAVLEALAARGYAYDASTFPSVVGPLARTYHLANSRLDAAEKARQKALFGGWRNALLPLAPYGWRLSGGATLTELPVTTMPFIRTPIHFTYVHFLAGFVPGLGRAYAGLAMRLCRARGVPPTLLLHATDFLGADDGLGLDFLPGMRRRAADRIALTAAVLDDARAAFAPLPLGRFADALARAAPLPERAPRFADAGSPR